MEVIKCPVCGNENCKEVMADKYVCLACDNVFLVHNLSKEFKQTDEHIERVYTDLKDTIISNSTTNNNLSSAYKSALSLVKRGEYNDAQKIFKDICMKYAWSYRGWYGCLLVAKNQHEEFNSEIYSLIIKVKNSEDLTDEVIQDVDKYLEAIKESCTAKMVNMLSIGKKKKKAEEAYYKRLRGDNELLKLSQKVEKASKDYKLAKIFCVISKVLFVLIGVCLVYFWLVYNSKFIVVKVLVLIAVLLVICNIPKAFGKDVDLFDIILKYFENREDDLKINLNTYNERLSTSEIHIQRLQEICDNFEKMKDISDKLDKNQLDTYKIFLDESNTNEIRNSIYEILGEETNMDVFARDE